MSCGYRNPQSQPYAAVRHSCGPRPGLRELPGSGPPVPDDREGDRAEQQGGQNGAASQQDLEDPVPPAGLVGDPERVVQPGQPDRAGARVLVEELDHGVVAEPVPAGVGVPALVQPGSGRSRIGGPGRPVDVDRAAERDSDVRSEEHTSELQSHVNLVCRLLLEKKKTGMYV